MMANLGWSQCLLHVEKSLLPNCLSSKTQADPTAEEWMLTGCATATAQLQNVAQWSSFK